MNKFRISAVKNKSKIDIKIQFLDSKKKIVKEIPLQKNCLLFGKRELSVPSSFTFLFK